MLGEEVRPKWVRLGWANNSREFDREETHQALILPEDKKDMTGDQGIRHGPGLSKILVSHSLCKVMTFTYLKELVPSTS